MADLSDLVVLVTGCSSGIGRALTVELERAGHRVIATARREAAIEDLRSARVLTCRLDVTDSSNIHEAVATAIDWGDRIDTLVSNAGFGLFGPVVELELDDVRRQLETNVVGALAVIQAVVPHMVTRGRGRIVNVGSVSGITATPFGGVYSASKAALHLLGDALRMEVAPFGIEVMTVQAGGVATDFPSTAAVGLEKFRASESLYQPVADGIEARARMSRAKAMSADDFARRLVAEMTRPKLRPVLRIGGGAHLLPTLQRLPTRTLDRILARRFGLLRLAKRS
jgi:NADP-dependent 3-hydroxy acid dehydrogenase YdfG